MCLSGGAQHAASAVRNATSYNRRNAVFLDISRRMACIGRICGRNDQCGGGRRLSPFFSRAVAGGGATGTCQRDQHRCFAAGPVYLRCRVPARAAKVSAAAGASPNVRFCRRTARSANPDGNAAGNVSTHGAVASAARNAAFRDGAPTAKASLSRAPPWQRQRTQPDGKHSAADRHLLCVSLYRIFWRWSGVADHGRA